MSLETRTEAPSSAQANAQSELEDGSNEFTKPRRRVNRFLIGGIVLALLLAGVGFYIHSTGFENTDDAQVEGHLNPIASRIDGTIKAVHVDDNQGVKPGMLLLELDPSDDQIALEQTQAQHDQALAQLSAAHPNLPMAVISNHGDLTSRKAEVTGSEAALSAAQHDLESVVARLKESQAVNDRDQADFAR